MIHVAVANVCSFFIAPPKITAPPENEHIGYAGALFVLNCAASGDPVPDIKWLTKGVVHSYSSMLELPKAEKSDEGLYQCFAINSAGVDGRVVKVTIKDPSRDNTGQSVILNCKLQLIDFL